MLRLLRTGSVARVASRSAARPESGAGTGETPKKKSVRLVAAALAGAMVLAPSVASATYYCHPKAVPVNGGTSAGPYIVGCIGGSALGLIAAAFKKKSGELTTQQAQTIAFSCGLGFFAVAKDLH